MVYFNRNQEILNCRILKPPKQKGVNMFIYENLNEFEENEENNELAVSPLAYVVLDCGR